MRTGGTFHHLWKYSNFDSGAYKVPQYCRIGVIFVAGIVLMDTNELITYLTSHGFNLDNTEYKKEYKPYSLVFRHNANENRFEVFYIGPDGTEDCPVYLYEDLYKDMDIHVFANYVDGLYDAIKTFDT